MAGGFTCRFTERDAERDAIRTLRFRAYDLHGLGHVTIPEQSQVAVALEDEHLVGCLHLVTGTLPVESLYPDEVAAMRARGEVVAELGGFAVDIAARTPTVKILDALARVVTRRALVEGITKLLIAVHPHHAAYYHRRLLFETVGEVRPYPLVHDALAVLMGLDLVGNRKALLAYLGP